MDKPAGRISKNLGSGKKSEKDFFILMCRLALGAAEFPYYYTTDETLAKSSLIRMIHLSIKLGLACVSGEIQGHSESLTQQ